MNYKIFLTLAILSLLQSCSYYFEYDPDYPIIYYIQKEDLCIVVGEENSSKVEIELASKSINFSLDSTELLFIHIGDSIDLLSSYNLVSEKTLIHIFIDSGIDQNDVDSETDVYRLKGNHPSDWDLEGKKYFSIWKKVLGDYVRFGIYYLDIYVKDGRIFNLKYMRAHT